MRRSVLHIAILLVLMAFPVERAYSQSWRFDFTSVEAGIDDHKRLRGIVIARSTIEQANKVLHENCKEANVNYRDINTELDKYTRLFDLIDIIYESASVVFSVYNTYEDVKEKVEGTQDLIDRYRKMIAEREYRIQQGISEIKNPKDAWDWFNTVQFPIAESDSVIFKIAEGVVTSVYNDAARIVSSCKQLALYAIPAGSTPPAACTTANIMTILQEIDDALAHIRLVVDQGYFSLWKYIHVRTGFWTQSLIPHKTVREICDDAYGRWKAAQKGRK